MPSAPASADRLVAAILRVNGSEDSSLYDCVEQIVVNEDLESGASFEVTIGLCRNDDGSWPHLDEQHLRPWNRVTVLVGFRGHTDLLMDGYISEVKVHADRKAGSVMMAVRGVDASYAMNLQEKTKVWKEKSFEDIAKEIIEQTYKLKAVLPAAGSDTSGGSSGSTPLPSVTQRGTDHRFLRELARRKGYEFFVRGGEVHFHPADLSGTPQKLIAAEFGDRTNCDDLQFEVDGTRPTEAEMKRRDPLTGKDQTVSAKSSGLTVLGTTELSSLRGFGVGPTKVIVRRQGAASQAQMEAYVQGLLRRHGWWIKAVGTLDGLRYGQVLSSQKLVTIKGLGKTYNGDYYVRKVTHTLTSRTYTMAFEAYRNGLQQKGTEDFTDENPEETPIIPALSLGSDSAVATVSSGAEVLPA